MICSHKQRQSYKEDFNKEYSEYRDLHARIDSVTQQFMELDTQLKRLHHDSHKYKVKKLQICVCKLPLFNLLPLEWFFYLFIFSSQTVRNKILQEYRKIKKVTFLFQDDFNEQNNNSFY